MTDEWDGTWGDGQWVETDEPATAIAPPLPERGRSLAGSSKLLILSVVAVVIVGFFFTTFRDREPEPSYKFTQFREDGVTPVGYNPCSTIRVAVNTANAPENADKLVSLAVEIIAEASGLDLVFGGVTSETPEYRDGKMRRPASGQVLVVWSDDKETPELKGSPVGIGGSATRLTPEGLPGWHAFGAITLDGPDVEGFSDDALVGILLHELGHVLGLSHVESSAEVMHPWARTKNLGPGDREGLAILGSLECQ